MEKIKAVSESDLQRASLLWISLQHYADAHRVLTDSKLKYKIMFNQQTEEFFVGSWNHFQPFGSIVFDTEEIALQAIKEYRDELEWYFTDYSWKRMNPTVIQR